jgi:hypothetical protein
MEEGKADARREKPQLKEAKVSDGVTGWERDADVRGWDPGRGGPTATVNGMTEQRPCECSHRARLLDMDMNVNLPDRQEQYNTKCQSYFHV